MTEILVGTKKGLYRFGPDGQRRKVEFQGREVTALAPEGWELWAILDGTEIVHTAGIEWWFRVGTLRKRGNCIADTRAGVIIGTAEAHLHRIAGDRGAEKVESFDKAPGRKEWFTPWGGLPDTRSITEDRGMVYVNVHVGGILRSADNGSSWQPTIEIEADIHKVVTGHDRVFGAGADGLWISSDKGATWTQHKDGLHATYCRAVAVCGDSILLSASTGPAGRKSTVYRTDVHAKSLERCIDDFFSHNIDSHCLDALPDGKLAAFGTHDGRLFASTDTGRTWNQIASKLPEVTRVLVV